MGNRQASGKQKSAATGADDVTTAEDGGDRKSEVGKKPRRRGRGRKVMDVAACPQPSELRGPSHPELITTTTLDTGEEETGSGPAGRRLLELTIYRSYSPAGTNGSAVSRGE